MGLSARSAKGERAEAVVCATRRSRCFFFGVFLFLLFQLTRVTYARSGVRRCLAGARNELDPRVTREYLLAIMTEEAVIRLTPGKARGARVLAGRVAQREAA